jgi:1-acyl-sn-glycerol-3-phosphate acyltransferase
LSAVLFLRGVKINVSGKIIEIAKVMIANHTSDLDYLLLPWAAGIKPYNIMAGINLKENKKTIEDWIIASTIGVIVENYSISVDREDKKSMIVAFLKMMRLIKDGERGLIFPGGTRLLISEIKEGKVLGDFKEGAFTLAWKTKVPIQPVVFDFPAIYHGKEDHRWGVHTCSIDVYYLDIVIPENYQNVDDFQEACHSMMEEKLKSSKKVQNFLKELQVS